MSRRMNQLVAFAATLVVMAIAGAQGSRTSYFEDALRGAKDALAANRLAEAEQYIDRALLRDPRSPDAWAARAAWAEATQRTEEQVYALHQEYRLRRAQKKNSTEVKALQNRLIAIDPIAADWFKMRDKHLAEILKIALAYDKEKRPHSAIRMYRQALAFEPDHAEAKAAIERISARPDASLAETAKPKDLLADVSAEFIREHDAKHSEWKTRSKLDRDNYVTQTDAGYEVMVRTGEAMEQMSRFYRKFFDYAADVEKGGVPKIDVLIFKNREEYLELGSGPPVEWSGGQFTGGSVETYIDKGGFEGMVSVLFHEAAHQYVSLATSASGWLNEGLASFFEGTRILANGTVLMNYPANHRLFPLRDRMKNGWMEDHTDGIDPNNASAEPTTAPTWEIILENKYPWGPAWYAPTWGVVYFLYNYQDPLDGRFVYRAAFDTFIDSSGGRTGDGAIRNFEETVLGNPSRVTEGYGGKSQFALPTTCAELNGIWKKWIEEIANEQSGQGNTKKPWLTWAECAMIRDEIDVATEHFEKGTVAEPTNVELHVEFGKHLLGNVKNPDRATKVLLQALLLLEADPKPDLERIEAVEDLLMKADPKRSDAKRLRKALQQSTEDIVRRYIDSGSPLIAMHLASRFGTEFANPSLFVLFEEAARKASRSVSHWELAYNERDLKGWAGSKESWTPYGAELFGRLGDYVANNWDYDFLTCDKVSSGDYSIDVELYADPGANAYCGVVFGRKSAETFHSFILYPGHEANQEKGRIARPTWVDLSTFFGANANKVWRHYQAPTERRGWRRLRLDITGSLVDAWFDGEFLGTQDFGGEDVLRGSFGLITGRGVCRFRNVKVWFREKNDLAASIERKLMLERFGAEIAAGTRKAPLVGNVAPPLALERWLQGGFTRMDELGGVPKLLVFWTIDINANLRINEWLMDLQQRTKSSGLEIITVAHWLEKDRIDEYLKQNPLPGHVGLDHRHPTKKGLGDTFAPFEAKSLPKLVFLDIDDVVLWEGDPGFVAGKPWAAGDQSYFDAPLEALIEQRKLPELKAFRDAWRTKGKPALGNGDFDAVLPLLKQSLKLSVRSAEVAEAQRFVRAIESTAVDVEDFAVKLIELRAEAALKPFLDLAARLDATIAKPALATVQPILQCPNAKQWEALVKKLDAAKAGLGKKGDPRAEFEAMAAEFRAAAPGFAQEIDGLLVESSGGDDLVAVRAKFDQLKRVPARFLARAFATP